MNMNQIENARQLLPWYITGMLSSSEVSFVKKAIAVCPSLQEDYEEQKALSQMIKQDPQVMDISVISTQEQRLDNLMKRIRIDKSQQDAVVTDDRPSFISNIMATIKQKFANMADFSTNRWAFTVIASVVIIQVALLGFFLSGQQNQASNVIYQSMSDETPEQAPEQKDDAPLPSNDTSIIIQFDTKATQEEISAVLKTIDGNIVEHPESSYYYQLAFNKPMTSEQIKALLLKIQENELIQFVGRGS